VRGLASLVDGSDTRQWNDGGVGPWFTPGGVGPNVTERSALTLSAVWACETLIADNISTLPLDVYRREDKRRIEVPTPEWLEEPNPETDRVDYDTMRILSLLGWGNSYSLIVREGGSVDPFVPITERWAIPPSDVTINRVYAHGPLQYTVLGMPMPTGMIQHIRGYRLPGSAVGESVIANARRSFGISESAETVGANFFENGITPSGVLQVPQLPAQVSKEVVERIRDTFSERYAGTGNARKPMVLTGGTTWEQITLNPSDAQFLETREFQVEEVCRWFRVPPHKVQRIAGNASQGGGAGLEQMALEFAQDGLLPWTVRLERADSRLLIGPREKQYVRYNLDAYVRVDLKTRMEAHEIKIRAGMATPNTELALEDAEPIVGGDHVRLPLQTTLITDATSKFDPGVANVIGGLVRAGFEPLAILAALGLPAIEHTGNIPVTVQAVEGQGVSNGTF